MRTLERHESRKPVEAECRYYCSTCYCIFIDIALIIVATVDTEQEAAARGIAFLGFGRRVARTDQNSGS
jgi:hypothetical protein